MYVCLFLLSISKNHHMFCYFLCPCDCIWFCQWDCLCVIAFECDNTWWYFTLCYQTTQRTKAASYCNSIFPQKLAIVVILLSYDLHLTHNPTFYCNQNGTMNYLFKHKFWHDSDMLLIKARKLALIILTEYGNTTIHAFGGIQFGSSPIVSTNLHLWFEWPGIPESGQFDERVCKTSSS